ncbi:MAG TPA: NUDIX domain-containing protein [Thermoanaerobaculia bacterium]|nr:NUDIX domain-containing protein [Thermoanaerobaculia bacterium]
MKLSAGLLLHCLDREGLSVLLGHPGGPYFSKKDDGHWTVPKGLVDGGECLYRAARREFLEETGMSPDAVPERSEGCVDLGEVRTRGGKRIRVWSFPGECAPSELSSNSFDLEWPPRSGRRASFPEIDRFELFPIEIALRKINASQRPLLERLLRRLAARAEDEGREESSR